MPRKEKINMAKKINLPEQVRNLLNMLHENNHEAYVVGGCVRDALLNRNPNDWDICTSATPEQILEVFKDKKVLEIGIKHGTVTVMEDGVPYEITTFRTDGNYSDGRHPDKVFFTTDIMEDLKRRDFTINAMAYNDECGVVDFAFEGQMNLMGRRIRCVGNPSDRFKEDALRILRAVRFACQLDFKVDAEIKEYFSHTNLKDRLGLVSAERIQSEFVKMIASYNIHNALWDHIEVFGSFIPELWDMVGFEQNNPYHCYDVFRHTVEALKYCDSDDLITRLTVFFHDFGKPSTYETDEHGIGHFPGHAAVSAEITDTIMRRLKFDNETREKVVELVKYHDTTLETSEKSVKRWLMRFGEEQFRRLLDVRLADISAQDRTNYNSRVGKVLLVKNTLEKVLEEESCFSLKDLAVNGNDLIQIGFKPGKDLGNVLNLLLNKVIDDELTNEKDILLEYAKKELEKLSEPICSYEKCLICDLKNCYTGQIAREKGKSAYDEFVEELGKSVPYFETYEEAVEYGIDAGFGKHQFEKIIVNGEDVFLCGTDQAVEENLWGGAYELVEDFCKRFGPEDMEEDDYMDFATDLASKIRDLVIKEYEEEHKVRFLNVFKEY